MATVASYEEVARRRRTRHQRETLRRCVEILRLNVEYNRVLLAGAIERDRPVLEARDRHLTALLSYAEAIA